MVNMTECHKCSCAGDCSETVRTRGELCERCATCTNDGCCKLDDTDESDDDPEEDDAGHGGRQGGACQGETAPGREKVNTQKISPAARWSGMDTSAWLKTLGALTSLQYGHLTAKLTKRGNHVVVKSWGRKTKATGSAPTEMQNSEDEAEEAKRSEHMDTCRRAWEAAMLRRMLETAEVEIDTAELTMKLEGATAKKEAPDNEAKREASKAMRKTLAAAEIMTLKMATNRPGAERGRSWRMIVAAAQSNERARRRASRTLKLSLQAAERAVKDDEPVTAWQRRWHRKLAATEVPYHPSIESVYMAAVRRVSKFTK